jgi:hypothetical protein
MDDDLADPTESGTYLSNYEALSRFSQLAQDIPHRYDFQKRVFDSSIRYLEEFAQFSGDSQHNAAKEAIRTRLRQRDDAFEEPQALSDAQDEAFRRQVEYDTVTLLNLCPTCVEDAQAMIPSLSSKSPHQVQELLDELQEFRG